VRFSCSSGAWDALVGLLWATDESPLNGPNHSHNARPAERRHYGLGEGRGLSHLLGDELVLLGLLPSALGVCLGDSPFKLGAVRGRRCGLWGL
jgi:hypothetical protein